MIIWEGQVRSSSLTLQDESVEEPSSEALKRRRILMALEESGGNRIVTAKSLEMSRSSLYHRMVKLGLID